MPISFWVVMTLLVGGGLLAFQRRENGTGLPVLAVLGTVATWYVGDAFYNDYAGTYTKEFDASTLAGAWWQVAWFILIFLFLVPLVHRWANRRYLRRRSGVLQLFQHGVGYSTIQQQLNLVFVGSALVWGGLFLVAAVVLKARIIYYLFPFFGHKASPWSHGQIGHGLDCFAILAVYLQLLSTTMFGVVASLATDRRIQYSALILCLLSWPFFIFDRTRNTMLAMAIPAVLGWVFLRMRGGLMRKSLVLLTCFCVVNFWMKFVIANRSHTSITQAFAEKGLNLGSEEKAHNEGLNMYEELCWISTFLDNGKYQINWGERYFAELVNPIPRGLWPGKPLIGIKYAIARGHHVINASGAVDTTIATGMVGQGVTNFGRIFGPLAAALLMSFWVAWLARFDLDIHALGRLPLYGLGLILTFNLGRDITLITLYPLVFGAMAVWVVERFRKQASQNTTNPVTVESDQTRRVLPAATSSTRSAGGKIVAAGRRLSKGGFVKRDKNRHFGIQSQRTSADQHPTA